MKIAVASGKGGTGKTFVATNLFSVAQVLKKDAVLIDCDAEAPNVHEFIQGEKMQTIEVQVKIPLVKQDECSFCNLCFTHCNYQAIFYLPERKMIHVTEELCHACGVCSYVCPANAIIERDKKIGSIFQYQYKDTFVYECKTEIGTASSVPVIKQGVKSVKNYPLVFLDSPPGISCPFIATVESVDYVLLVAEPTPFGLHDLQLSIETLREMEKPFGVLINRANSFSKDMQAYLNKEGIEILLEIPFDKNIASMYAEGKILVEKDKKYQEIFISLMKNIEKDITSQWKK